MQICNKYVSYSFVRDIDMTRQMSYAVSSVPFNWSVTLCIMIHFYTVQYVSDDLPFIDISFINL